MMTEGDTKMFAHAEKPTIAFIGQDKGLLIY
jgi:hypothetical protein